MVGTHALIEPEVAFDRLAVCVVDEQHRFGVRQRAALDAKGPARGGAARPSHDRDADPSHPVADRLRRSRRHRPSRAAGGTPAGRDLGGGGGEEGRRLRVHPRAAARGPPGVRRLPAGARGSEEARGEGRGRGGRPPARRRARRLRGRPAARPDAAAREAGRDGAVCRRADRRAGGDERDRGGDRRRQRDRDPGRGRGALRPLPAPSASRPRGAWRARLALHPVRRRRLGAGPSAPGGDRGRAATASSWRRSTWRCAARGRSSAPGSTACRAFAWRSFPRTSPCSPRRGAS